MCRWILQQNGKFVPQQTIRRLRPEELTVTNVSESNKRNSFDAEIRDRIGESISLPENEGRDSLDPDYNFDVDSEDEDAFKNIVPKADDVDSVGNRINQQSVADLLINADILLPRGEAVQMAKVLCRSIDADGNIVRTFDDNPNLNTLVYDVEFPDGAVKQYAANVIAENVLI